MKALIEIRCPVQTYHWGKVGLSSKVAQLASKGKHVDTIEEGCHYAEMWMGTHTSKPSLLVDGTSLRDHIGGDLSFLFKILSVETALSIQAHPNRSHAAELKHQFPEHYPDSNHKPEIAIALTQFEALCCFRPLREIECFINGIPELKSVLGQTTLSNKKDLQATFGKLMGSPEGVFKPQLEILFARLSKGEDDEGVINKDIRRVFLGVHSQYPDDIGLFVFFFLNYLTLAPGEALFLAANEPHAYLSGDCVECMACSDNVVRAGLTPKFKDVPTLVSMLTYDSTSQVKFAPTVLSSEVNVYRPPVEDFAVLRYHLRGQGGRKLQKVSGSVLIVIQGSGKLVTENESISIKEGSIVYISPQSEVTAEGDLLIFQAYSP